MSLLDIDMMIDEVITQDYLLRNGWFVYDQIYLDPLTKKEETYEFATKRFEISYNELWIGVSFRENGIFIHNMSTGDVFESMDILTLETLIEKWIKDFK